MKLQSYISTYNIFVKSSEIMDILRIKKGTFYKLKKRADFPKALHLCSKPVWKTSDILEWAEKINSKPFTKDQNK